MLPWRAAGRIVVIRKSPCGLHIALQCPCLELSGRRLRDLRWVIALCTDPALANRLERAQRADDYAALGGRTERCTREVHPLVAHGWDLIVGRWFMFGPGGTITHALRRLVRPSVNARDTA